MKKSRTAKASKIAKAWLATKYRTESYPAWCVHCRMQFSTYTARDMSNPDPAKRAKVKCRNCKYDPQPESERSSMGKESVILVLGGRRW